MKYGKYLVFIMLLIIFGINRVNAAVMYKCYYVDNLNNPNNTAYVNVQDNGEAISWFENVDTKHNISDKEGVLNWYRRFPWLGDKDSITGMELPAIYDSKKIAKQNGECPEYLIMRVKIEKNGEHSYGSFATNDLQTAIEFVNASNVSIANSEYKAFYLIHKNSDGSEITEEQYEEVKKEIQERVHSAVVNPNYNFGGGGINTSDGYTKCNEELIGSDIKALLKEILKYPRVIVPIIIVVLGTIDLFKAVIAGKEDEMKKAQKTFIKRVIMGVCVFLVPVFMDVIIWLTNMAWQGLGFEACPF